MSAEVRSARTSNMERYRSWLDLRWIEWRRLNGLSATERITYAGHRAFDAWLQFRSERNQLAPAAPAAASSPG